MNNAISVGITEPIKIDASSTSLSSLPLSASHSISNPPATSIGKSITPDTSESRKKIVPVSNVVDNEKKHVTKEKTFSTEKHVESTILTSKSTSSSSISTFTSSSSTSNMSPSLSTVTRATTSLPPQRSMTWNEFISLPSHTLVDSYQGSLTDPSYSPIICPADVNKVLADPILTTGNKSWCEWALSPAGGNVQVGKSWGNLARDNAAKLRFDDLNCNSVSKGKNPSCADKWGDTHMSNWKNSIAESVKCDNSATSKLHCYDNENNDRFCVVDNLQINFDMMKIKKRAPHTDSRTFEKGFLSTDCLSSSSTTDGSKFLAWPHLYKPQLASGKVCDYVINGTTLVFSHDDIRNAGHFIADLMNVWVVLWMGKAAASTKQISFLNIDSFNLGHCFNDEPNHFFETYFRTFGSFLKGSSFGGKTICLQRALLQPLPPAFFVRDGWNKDQHCSFVGPSSMYQRFNLHARDVYGLLAAPNLKSDKKLRVIFIIRAETANLWGNMRIARQILNQDQVLKDLKKALESIVLPTGDTVELVPQNLASLTLTQQIELFSTSSLVMGMHGAGIPLAMAHLPIGTRYCCGVLEIYPEGEFTPIRGHGNMAREFGHHYDRLDLSRAESQPNGAIIVTSRLVEMTVKMVNSIINKPTCVLSNVRHDPFLKQGM